MEENKGLDLIFEMLKNMNEKLDKTAEDSNLIKIDLRNFKIEISAKMEEKFEKMDRNFEKIEVTFQQVREENKLNLEKLEITMTNKLQQKIDETEKENVIKDIEKDEKERDYSRIDSMQKNMEIINESKDSKNDVVIGNKEMKMLSEECNIDNMKKEVGTEHEHEKMGNMKNNIAIISEVEDRKIEIIILNEEYNAETMKKEIEEYNGMENIKGDIEENLIGKIDENKVFNQSDLVPVNVNTSGVNRVIPRFYIKFQRINKNIMKKKLRLIHVRPFKRKNKKGCMKKKKKKKYIKICNLT